jgi:hypothetical protein
MSDVVRVLRILEYVGPREWVEQTLSQGSVPARGQYGIGHGWTIRSAILGEFPEILENNNGEKSNSSDS